MAMQVGLSVSRILLLAGAGYTGTIVLKDSKLVSQLEKLIKGGGGESEDDVTAQLRRLATEVRQMGSAQPITILNGGGSGTSSTSLLLPAAALGTIGYAYMWWKGIRFSDFMYVTKESISTAAATLKTNLEQVADALAATKRQLTKKIEDLGGKLDQQKQISESIKKEINVACRDISEINFGLGELERMIYGYDEKMLSLDAKQDVANAGLMHLCSIAYGKKVRIMPSDNNNKLRVVANSIPGIEGVLDSLDSANIHAGDAINPQGRLTEVDSTSQCPSIH